MLREAKKDKNCARIRDSTLTKDRSKSDSNFCARSVKFAKITAPSELNKKKTKLKKHSASKISSLKTINSKKQRIENKKREARKKISNIEKKRKTTITKK